MAGGSPTAQARQGRSPCRVEEGQAHEPRIAVHRAQRQPVLALHACTPERAARKHMLDSCAVCNSSLAASCTLCPRSRRGHRVCAHVSANPGAQPQRRCGARHGRRKHTLIATYCSCCPTSCSPFPPRLAGRPLHPPSRAKLMPNTGSGSSGGTSSVGRSTLQLPSGWPYRHRFSRSGPAAAYSSLASAQKRGGRGPESRLGLFIATQQDGAGRHQDAR